jgi:hypothetical protein
VYEECRNVFLRNKVLVPRYLKAIEIYPDSSNKEVNKIWADDFLDEYIASEELDEIESRTLRGFVKRNADDIARMLVGEISKEEYIDTILRAVRASLNALDKQCNPNSPVVRRYDVADDYRSLYRRELTELQRSIMNRNDVMILLDSYYIRHKYIGRDVLFMTMDKADLLNNKDIIEKTMQGLYIAPLP